MRPGAIAGTPLVIGHEAAPGDLTRAGPKCGAHHQTCNLLSSASASSTLLLYLWDGWPNDNPAGRVIQHLHGPARLLLKLPGSE